MILMGHNTDTTTTNSVERVFITKNAGTREDGHKKQNNEDQHWKKEGQGNNSPPSPKRTAPSTVPPHDGKEDHRHPKTGVDDDGATHCDFCVSRKKLK